MTPAGHLLVVDDNATNRRLAEAIFRAEGFQVELVDSGQAALAALRAKPPSAVLLDLQMPGMDGLATLGAIRELAPDVPVVMITAHGDIPSAVEAIKRGAYDFVTRPIHNDQLVLQIKRALERRQLMGEVKTLRKRLASEKRLVGRSAAMQHVERQIDQVAESMFTVLIQGETGTGKELVARAIHDRSARAGSPFVALDCGAIPDSLLESELFGYERGAFTGADRKREGYLTLASKGSLFLDEIGNLSGPTQAKLLRVMQERVARPLGGSREVAIDVRFIAATNESIGAPNDESFRKDLYFRLAEFVIKLPPLRERREDIRDLADRFRDDACQELRRSVATISDEGVALLESHSWPGNVRELRNVVRQAVLQASGPVLGPDDLQGLVRTDGRAPTTVTAPIAIPAGATLKEIAERAAAEAEGQAIREALRTTRGNKTQAARLLTVDFKTLHLKMKRLGIRAWESDGEELEPRP